MGQCGRGADEQAQGSPPSSSPLELQETCAGVSGRRIVLAHLCVVICVLIFSSLGPSERADLVMMQCCGYLCNLVSAPVMKPCVIKSKVPQGPSKTIATTTPVCARGGTPSINGSHACGESLDARVRQ